MSKVSLLLRLAAASAFMLICFVIPSVAGDAVVLDTPSADDLALIAYNLAGAEPPFADLAETSNSVRSLNEFKRPEAGRALEAQMRARFQQLKSVKQVRLNVYSQFGEYNGRYNEFDFDISDGTVIKFQHALQKNLAVHLTNGGLAQSWSVPPADAEKIVSQLGRSRNVTLSMKLDLTGASLPVSDYEPIAIDARVVEYDIVGLQKNMKLGHVVVK